jgi:hypothetical protein
MKLEHSPLAMLITIAPKTALQKPTTSKPSTNQLARLSIPALRISRKRPRVRRVNGSVSKTRSGLTKALINPSAIAAQINASVELALTPGTRYAVSQIPNPIITVLKIIPNIVAYHLRYPGAFGLTDV